MQVSLIFVPCSGFMLDGPGRLRSLSDCVKLSGHGDEQELFESMNLKLLATLLKLLSPFLSSKMSSTPSSIGDDTDWKLLNLKLDARDNSPSVIDPKAESCDGLLHPNLMPRIEYSVRRVLEFL